MCFLSCLLLLALVVATEEQQPTEIVLQETATELLTANSSEINTETQEETAFENKVTPVVITNAIEPSMLAYKHWTGTYSPDVFNVTINDTPVTAGNTYTLDSIETPLIVQFDYSFMNGMRKGSKKISYQMKAECTNATLTFSWLDPWKVLLDNATPLSEEVVS